MQISRALKVSREYRGWTQRDLQLPYSQSMLSMVESGQREMAQDVMRIASEQLDHPTFIAAAIKEATGLEVTWLDQVDLHPASVFLKTLEEIQEAVDAMNQNPAYIPARNVDEKSRKARYEHLIQCFDAWIAMYHYISVQCLEFDFSMLKLSRDHANKLKSRKYALANA